MQIMRLSGGRATRITTLEDTHNLHQVIAELSAPGIAAATAPPIGMAAGVA